MVRLVRELCRTRSEVPPLCVTWNFRSILKHTMFNSADSRFLRAEIVHHEDLPRLRQLHDTIVSTRQQVAGCTDPDATNFNPVANVRPDPDPDRNQPCASHQWQASA